MVASSVASAVFAFGAGTFIGSVVTRLADRDDRSHNPRTVAGGHDGCDWVAVGHRMGESLGEIAPSADLVPACRQIAAVGECLNAQAGDLDRSAMFSEPAGRLAGGDPTVRRCYRRSAGRSGGPRRRHGAMPRRAHRRGGGDGDPAGGARRPAQGGASGYPVLGEVAANAESIHPGLGSCAMRVDGSGHVVTYLDAVRVGTTWPGLSLASVDRPPAALGDASGSVILNIGVPHFLLRAQPIIDADC